jgi:hypothetical protein
MTKAEAPTKSTKATPEGHHRLDGTSFTLKSIGGPDYDDWKKTEPLVDGFVPVSQSDSMLRDDNNTNMTVAARKHPPAPNALLPCHLQPCGMRTVDKATLCNSGTNAFAPKAALGVLEIQLLLYPRKQTQLGNRGMPEMCQLGSRVTQSRLPLFPQQQTFLSPVVTSVQTPPEGGSHSRLVRQGRLLTLVRPDTAHGPAPRSGCFQQPARVAREVAALGAYDAGSVRSARTAALIIATISTSASLS